MKRRVKRIIKRAVWLAIKIMSNLHISVDRLAHYADKQNLAIWKRFLTKSLTIYNQIEDNGNDD